MLNEDEAQILASKYMEAEPGTPMLREVEEKLVYVVPALIEGMPQGEIYIDAETGKNLGGAGGG